MIDVQIHVHDIAIDGFPETTHIDDNSLHFYHEGEWVKGTPTDETDHAGNPLWERHLGSGLTCQYSGIRYYAYLPTHSIDSPVSGNNEPHYH
jgi:hypothetical protein